MSEPTKAQLQEDLTKTRARAQRFEQALSEVDGEARAYDQCVKALSKLTASDRNFRSEKRPDREAIRRVLDTLKARFDIGDPDQGGPGIDYFEPELHVSEDARDTVISQLIDALRKS